MKEHYQYFTDKNNEVTAISCTIKTDDGKLGRGVSVRCKTDKPNAVLGKVMAQRRAMRAVKGRDDVVVSDIRVARQLAACNCPYTKLSCRYPDLSFGETLALSGKYFTNDVLWQCLQPITLSVASDGIVRFK